MSERSWDRSTEHVGASPREEPTPHITGVQQLTGAHLEELYLEARELAEGPLERLIAVLEERRQQRQDLLDLRNALASRPLVDQAKGILMARYGASPEQAFAILRRWSQARNVKLRELARVLVQATAQPVSSADSPDLPRPFLLGRPANLRLADAEDAPLPDEPDVQWVPRVQRSRPSEEG